MFLVAGSVPYKQMGKRKKWGRHAVWKSSVDMGRWPRFPQVQRRWWACLPTTEATSPCVHVTFWLLLNDTLTQGWRDGAEVRITCCSSEDPSSAPSTMLGCYMWSSDSKILQECSHPQTCWYLPLWGYYNCPFWWGPNERSQKQSFSLPRCRSNFEER